MYKITALMIAGILCVSSTVSAADFYDTKGHWAEQTIDNLAEKGIVSGVDVNRFAPDGVVTRAQYLKMIMEVLSIGTTEFRDGECLEARADSWYAPYLQKALDCGLIPDEMIISCSKTVQYEVDENGNATSSRVIYSGAFNGDLPIRREEMAALTQFCFQYSRTVLTNDVPELDEKLIYSDASDCSDWAINSIKQSSAYGFMTGMSDGKFYPKNNGTRAEAATIIERVMNYSGGDSKNE